MIIDYEFIQRYYIYSQVITELLRPVHAKSTVAATKPAASHRAVRGGDERGRYQR